ncbi:protein RFT1 homolog [Galendromus occidentalis]|uniref:Protein RFT1 homolog n=1 Tax=Galendromus occidentalis TaxID=34638 RepID=A0AAJ6QKI8_9ACAR|nr:protein RFT1 homolog [Galendromus occidentalis]
MAEEGRVAAALKATSLNIILHISMRICTFVLNAFILRHVTKYSFGVINVRLMLLFSTIHFLASEPFRRACCTNTSHHKWPKVITLSWLSVPLAAVVGAVLSLLWVHGLESPEDPTYPAAVLVTFIAAIIEVSAEPMFIVGCASGYVKFKVFAEGSALAFRCISMSLLIVMDPDNALMAYAISQLLSSVYFSLVFYVYFHYVCSRKLDKALPIARISQMLPSLEGVDRRVGSLAASFMKQTVFKQVLTEGERYVMTTFCVIDFASQGVYEAVNNLGSLAARYIFQQVEENGYLLFGQILSRGDARKKSDVLLGAEILSNLLKLMLIVALIIVAFGQAYSGTLLYLYAGESLLPLGKTLMRFHCVYIAFIAINGITECFVFATMTKDQLDEHNRKMAMCSIVFLVASYAFSKVFGAVGLILANMVNMSLRVVLSFIYIREHHKGVGVDIIAQSIPDCRVIAMLVFSCGCCLVSEFFVGEIMLLHILFGGILFILSLLTLFFFERDLKAFIQRSLIEKRI